MIPLQRPPQARDLGGTTGQTKDLLADFCRTDPARLKGIAMINLDDVPDGVIPPPFTIRCKVG